MEFQPAMLRSYLVAGTQDVKDPNKTLPQIVKAALAAGITAFQYREKGAGSLSDPKQRLQMAQELKALCNEYHVPFIVDDDVELAKAVHADGVHVGQKDERVTQVIEQVTPEMFVGLSCNTVKQINLANQIDGISYIGSGPVFPTNSKADADPVISLDYLKELVEVSDYPIVAIGGITEANISQLKDTGIWGASIISMVVQSPDINKTVNLINNTF